MGLIRSKNTSLTPFSDDGDLTAYLWPIVREMIKTAVENGQNLIVEGCYIPFDWKKDFEKEYLDNIKYCCLVMSEAYIRANFSDIKKYASVIEKRLDEHEQKIEFFVRTSLPPVEGIFYNGQIFDAYVFATELIRSADKRLILIDNYIDESVLLMLSKRKGGVTAEIMTGKVSSILQQDLVKHNAQYPPIVLTEKKDIHDRFLIVDEDVYHIGASLKDLGKKLFAFSKMSLPTGVLI
jgi:hypothetical protein